MDTVVTNTFHRAVAAPPEIASGSLALVHSFRSLRHALTALGIDDRVVSVHRTAPAGFDLVWRLPDNGRARVAWTASVEPDGEDQSFVSVAVRVAASDEASRERVLAAWPLLGPLVQQETRRIVAGIAANAEEASGPEVFAVRAAA